MAGFISRNILVCVVPTIIAFLSVYWFRKRRKIKSFCTTLNNELQVSSEHFLQSTSHKDNQSQSSASSENHVEQHISSLTCTEFAKQNGHSVTVANSDKFLLINDSVTVENSDVICNTENEVNYNSASEVVCNSINEVVCDDSKDEVTYSTTDTVDYCDENEAKESNELPSVSNLGSSALFLSEGNVLEEQGKSDILEELTSSFTVSNQPDVNLISITNKQKCSDTSSNVDSVTDVNHSFSCDSSIIALPEDITHETVCTLVDVSAADELLISRSRTTSEESKSNSCTMVSAAVVTNNSVPETWNSLSSVTYSGTDSAIDNACSNFSEFYMASSDCSEFSSESVSSTTDNSSAKKEKMLPSFQQDKSSSACSNYHSEVYTNCNNANVVFEISSLHLNENELLNENQRLNENECLNENSVVNEKTLINAESKDLANVTNLLFHTSQKALICETQDTDVPACNKLKSETNGIESEVSISPVHSDPSLMSDAQSEDSCDSSKGCEVQNAEVKILGEIPDRYIYEFELPQDLCGRLIGKHGKHVKYVKERSNANVYIKRHPVNPQVKIAVVEGNHEDVNNALDLIRRKFPPSQFPNLTLAQTNVVSHGVPIPESLQLRLPDGSSCDVILSSMVNAGHFFLQQPTHPTYPSLCTLDQCMLNCYSQVETPPLPQPVEAGVICAAPIMNGWFRAQVVYALEGGDECIVRFVDYGGYSQILTSSLRQIRSDFMTLPFQASECYLGNVQPLNEDVGWSTESSAAFEELAQGQILQAVIVDYADDGKPYVHLYRVQGISSTFINEELVNRGLAKWVDTHF